MKVLLLLLLHVLLRRKCGRHWLNASGVKGRLLQLRLLLVRGEKGRKGEGRRSRNGIGLHWLRKWGWRVEH